MPNHRCVRHLPTRLLSPRWLSAAGLLLTSCAGLLLTSCAAENEDIGGGGQAPTSGGGGAGGTPIVSGGGGAGSGGALGGGGSGGEVVVGGEGPVGGEGGQGGMPPNNCGNGVLDDNEQCEGSEFGDKTCATFGLSGGFLVCNTFCGIVVSNCTPLEQCFDGLDNDEDGLPDCADDECASELICTDPCSVIVSSPVPQYPSGSMSGEPDVLTSSCAPNGGQEALFAVEAAIDGDMSASFFPSNFDGALSVRTVCNDVATEIACVNNGGSNSQEAVSFPVTAGTTYYILFESTSPNAFGDYWGSIDQLLPEQWCGDQWDDDQDGFLDCDDPTACKGIQFECQPGASTYGTTCFSNTNCAATGGDPICLNWNQGFNNGYCSEFCDGPGDCAGDGVCVDINISFHGVCFDGCVTSADCANGNTCVPSPSGQLICDKPPEVNCQDYNDNDFDGLEDCLDPTACATSFSCQSGPLTTGSPCQIHAECESNGTDPFCIDQTHIGWPGGYCSQYCDLALQDCEAGSTCSNSLFFTNAPICLETCVLQTDCRSGYFCADMGPGPDVCIF